MINNDKVSVLLTDVKAAPSVYSPNFGSFNSEENIKWIANKIATKPFVIGKTTAEMRNNLYPTLNGNTISVSDGMFNIDGYTIKLAPTENISFDTPIETDNEVVTLDISSAETFIQNLTNNSTYHITSDFDVFCFDTYKPSEHDDSQTDWDDMQTDWDNAVKTHTAIGYIKLAYTGDILDYLDVTTYTVRYGDSVVKVVSGVTGIDDANNNADPEGIKTFINDPSVNTYGLTLKDPFAVVGVNDVQIYYPVFVKLHKNSTVDTKYPIVYFTDICGIDFTQSQSYESSDEIIPDVGNLIPELATTNYYPNTCSCLMNIGGNKPLSDIGITDPTSICQIKTMPLNICDYSALYNISGAGEILSRKTSSDTIIDYHTWPFPTVTTDNVSPEDHIINIRESISGSSKYVFVKKTLSDIVSLIPSADTKYTEIKNTLYYYCLNLESTDLQNGNIPVAFMSSDGKLCPNGLVIDELGTTVTSEYPLEGYVHFIKRKYLIMKGRTVSEEAIEELTFESMSNEDSATLQTIYDNYILKPMSFYFSFCYSSIMEHSILAGNSTDSQRKAISAGETITGTGVVDTGKAMKQTYTYTGYEKSNNSMISKQYTTDVYYYKNIDSDKTILSSAKSCDSTYGNIYGTLGYFKSILNMFSGDEGKIATLFDDPFNYLKKCGLKTVTTETVLPTFTLYTFYSSTGENNYFLGNGYDFANVVLNEQGVPTTPDVEVTELGAENTSNSNSPYVSPYNLVARFLTNKDSLVNSWRFYFNTDSWYGSVWETINVKRDAQYFLCGADQDLENYYDGIHFYQKLRSDFDKDDLGIYNIKISSELNTFATGQEINDKYILYSDEADVLRGAYIHIDKVYGDDDKSLRQILSELSGAEGDIDLSEILSRLLNLENIIGDINTPNTVLYDISHLKTDVALIEQKLNPFIVATFNLGENKDNPTGDPTNSVIAEVYNNGEVVVKGVGKTYDFNLANPSPLTSYDINDYYTLGEDPEIKPITHIKVLPGVTYLGDYLFSSIGQDDADHNFIQLIGVELPNSVNEIGKNTFASYYDEFGLDYYTDCTCQGPNTIQFDINGNNYTSVNEAFTFAGSNLYDVKFEKSFDFSVPTTNFIYSYNLRRMVVDTEYTPYVGHCYQLRNLTLTNNVSKIHVNAQKIGPFLYTGFYKINYNDSMFKFLNLKQQVVSGSPAGEYWNWTWPRLNEPDYVSKNHINPFLTYMEEGTGNIVPVSTSPINGVYFKLRDDKTILVNGTATGDIIVYVKQNFTLPIPSDYEYTLSGCPITGSDSTYYMDVTDGTSSVKDYGYSVNFTPVINSQNNKQSVPQTVRIIIKSGTTLTNAVFRPMVCLASDYFVSPDFEPYQNKTDHEFCNVIDCTDAILYFNSDGLSKPSIVNIELKQDIVPWYFLSATKLPVDTQFDLCRTVLDEDLPFTVTIHPNTKQIEAYTFFGRTDVTDIIFTGTAVQFKDIIKGNSNPETDFTSYDWASKSDVITGYYYSGSFYEDAEHTTPISGNTNKIYADVTTNVHYKYTGTAYTQVTTNPNNKFSTIMTVTCTGEIEDSVFVYDSNYYTANNGEFKLITYRGVTGNWIWDDTTHDFIQ